MMATAYQPGRHNIGPMNRALRLLAAAVFLAAGTVLAHQLAASGAPRLWRVLVFTPFALGFLFLVEAVFGFDVFLARARRYEMW